MHCNDVKRVNFGTIHRLRTWPPLATPATAVDGGHVGLVVSLPRSRLECVQAVQLLGTEFDADAPVSTGVSPDGDSSNRAGSRSVPTDGERDAPAARGRPFLDSEPRGQPQ